MRMLSMLLFGLAVTCLTTTSLHAQTGCVNSPENPTAILAAVGSAGAVFFSRRSRK